MGSEIDSATSLTAADVETLAEAIGQLQARQATLSAIDKIARERLAAIMFSASTYRMGSLEI